MAASDTGNLEEVEAPRALALSGGDGSAGMPRRRRGRPLEMPPEAVLEHIRSLARHGDGLFRVHRTQPGLYARARRMFGSWAAAVDAAGLDYQSVQERARERAVMARRRD